MSRATKKAHMRPMTTLECIRCHETKPITSFDRGRRQCKKCRLDIKRERYNPERQKVINDRAAWKTRARRYGVPEDDLRAMWDRQDHKCAICGRDDVRSPHTDHNHQTLQVRELLCARCNRIIGMVREDPVLLEKCATYLRYHAQQEEHPAEVAPQTG